MQISDKDIEVPIILLFALYVNRAYPIEKRMSGSIDFLKKKLRIKHFPSYLVNDKHLILHKKYGVFSNYSCIEPQVYTTNCKFLVSDILPQHKRDYIYMLSLRAMNNTNNFIPADYVEEELYTNPFISLQNNKIIFPLEKTYD